MLGNFQIINSFPIIFSNHLFIYVISITLYLNEWVNSPFFSNPSHIFQRKKISLKISPLSKKSRLFHNILYLFLYSWVNLEHIFNLDCHLLDFLTYSNSYSYSHRLHLILCQKIADIRSHERIQFMLCCCIIKGMEEWMGGRGGWMGVWVCIYICGIMTF